MGRLLICYCASVVKKKKKEEQEKEKLIKLIKRIIIGRLEYGKVKTKVKITKLSQE